MALWKTKAEAALQQTIRSVEPLSPQAAIVTTKSGRYVCKFAPSSGSQFAAEAEGLKALSPHVRVPQVFAAESEVLVLEWLEAAEPKKPFWSKLGQALAKLHTETAGHKHFGFAHDNFIGPTPQANPQRATNEISWAEYFLEYRLQALADHPTLAADSLLQVSFQGALTRIRARLLLVKELPSLVHGDLWSGNFICGADQSPSLIDPACYFGHREVDLAMSELFGGFAPEFYKAYRAALPLTDGYKERQPIYNLYHLFNHWILFGESYRRQTLETLKAIQNS